MTSIRHTEELSIIRRVLIERPCPRGTFLVDHVSVSMYPCLACMARRPLPLWSINGPVNRSKSTRHLKPYGIMRYHVCLYVLDDSEHVVCGASTVCVRPAVIIVAA